MHCGWTQFGIFFSLVRHFLMTEESHLKLERSSLCLKSKVKLVYVFICLQRLWPLRCAASLQTWLILGLLGPLKHNSESV